MLVCVNLWSVVRWGGLAATGLYRTRLRPWVNWEFQGEDSLTWDSDSVSPWAFASPLHLRFQESESKDSRRISFSATRLAAVNPKRSSDQRMRRHTSGLAPRGQGRWDGSSCESAGPKQIQQIIAIHSKYTWILKWSFGGKCGNRERKHKNSEPVTQGNTKESQTGTHSLSSIVPYNAI